MIYKYSGFDKNGKKIKGKIEASSIEEAKEKLNIYVTDIKPAFSFGFTLGKVKKSEIATVLNTIGLYLKASIPLKKAINLAKNQTENPKIIRFLNYVENEINSGKSLSNAIQSQKIIKLPDFIKHSINVAENSGRLDIVLIELSRVLKEEEKVSSKTAQALIYPLFIITMSIILVIVMLTTIVPKIVKIFQNLHQNLPTATQIVINASKFVQNNWILIVSVFLAIIVLFRLFYAKSKKFKLFIDSFLLKIPLLKRLIISKDLGRFSYMSYVLINSGVNYINAINLAANTVSNEKIKNFFKKALDEVIEGKKFSTALKKENFFEKSFVQAVALGEETGEIKQILNNLYEIYNEEYNSKTSAFLSLLEPVMMILIGGVIGFIVTAMLLPIFSMNIGS